ncbi:hypothetical protein CB0940_04891 [Cercospora beticola]|uniref:DNA/RNA-binding protein Alba-like domain-containing protein n=1 Tax=Cercospora beticola TaxID=122368 RepID=A0A2G5HJ28_CERBT|nr:hypothetical protein CB0940_04891 [Cercospora beticola]PIA92564.1 hypothetical protein CB0940_04891 [Cercospora beticola]WPB02174.1 hypothetical protein RHO25_006808 [Cercospora beticola]CAK1362967.1 unnamed protein product [Cercospora beticola]
MAFEEPSLQGKYAMEKFGVASGTQISSRTSAVVGKLVMMTTRQDDTTAAALPVVVAITATSPKAAGKLVSIVEIAKRDLVARKVPVYQYSALSSRLDDIPRHGNNGDDKTKRGEKGSSATAGGGGEQDDESSDDAFEVMGQAQGSETKKRNVPVLTVYLSTVSVKELKVAFGEQQT